MATKSPSEPNNPNWLPVRDSGAAGAPVDESWDTGRGSGDFLLALEVAGVAGVVRVGGVVAVDEAGVDVATTFRGFACSTCSTIGVVLLGLGSDEVLRACMSA